MKKWSTNFASWVHGRANLLPGSQRRIWWPSLVLRHPEVHRNPRVSWERIHYWQEVSSETIIKVLLKWMALYKRNYDLVLLRCVDKSEENWIIMEIHEGSFGTHASGHTMFKKILRAGYYWMTMEVDCYLYIQTCQKYQIYADKIHVPPITLNVLTSTWPFSMWGIDVIGCIEPTASNRNHFILVAIDYFTKWVEVVSYANVIRQVVARFIWKKIICLYGVPNKIIIDNGSNLNSKMMKELCQSFKIEHHNLSSYRPKMNGVVKATNKNINKVV